MALSPLDAALEKLDITDGKFAKLCGKHRTEIWAYRHRTRTPNSHTASQIIEALRKLGVEMTLDELLCKSSEKAA
jgi:hypothetical protein